MPVDFQVASGQVATKRRQNIKFITDEQTQLPQPPHPHHSTAPPFHIDSTNPDAHRHTTAKSKCINQSNRQRRETQIKNYLKHTNKTNTNNNMYLHPTRRDICSECDAPHACCKCVHQCALLHACPHANACVSHVCLHALVLWAGAEKGPRHLLCVVARMSVCSCLCRAVALAPWAGDEKGHCHLLWLAARICACSRLLHALARNSAYPHAVVFSLSPENMGCFAPAGAPSRREPHGYIKYTSKQMKC